MSEFQLWQRQGAPGFWRLFSFHRHNHHRNALLRRIGQNVLEKKLWKGLASVVCMCVCVYTEMHTYKHIYMHVYTCISYTCFSLNIHFKVTVNGHSTALILVWFINCLFFPVLKRGWTLCRSLKAVSVCTAGLIRTHLFVFIQCLEAEVCIIVNDATLPSVGQNLQAHCPVGLLTWHYIVILIKTSVCSRPDKLLVCICKCPVSSLPPFGDFKNKSWGNLQ